MAGLPCTGAPAVLSTSLRPCHPPGIIVAVPPTPHEAAVSELAGTDPVLADLVDRHGPPPARRRVPVDRRFGDLARNIVY